MKIGEALRQERLRLNLSQSHILCNKKRKLGGETKNTASSIDEGMNLFLLLFAFNDII